MAALSPVANSGKNRLTGVSMVSCPRSTSCSTAIEVNSFEIDAMSKMVSLRIGTCCSAGSSVPAASAYRSAPPTAYRSTTTPSWASRPTAPEKCGCPVASGFVQLARKSSAALIGAGSSPASFGLPSRRVVHGAANPCCGRSKRLASSWRPMALAPEVKVVSATSTPVAAARTFLARTSSPSAVEQVATTFPVELGQLGPPGAGDLVDARAGVDHGPQAIGPGKLVDVVVGAPREDVRVQRLRRDEHGDRGADRVESPRVADTDLHAPTGLVDELSERRHEVDLAELRPGQLQVFELLAPAPVEPGRADD